MTTKSLFKLADVAPWFVSADCSTNNTSNSKKLD
jgi:hypothetical protein